LVKIREEKKLKTKKYLWRNVNIKVTDISEIKLLQEIAKNPKPFVIYSIFIDIIKNIVRENKKRNQKRDNLLRSDKVFLWPYLVFSGYFLSLGFVFCFFIVFICAYLNPLKQVLVDIDSFGEADFELVLIFVVLFFILFGFFCFVRNWRKNKLKRQGE